LVAGDTNGVNDVFLHDRNFATTERISKSSFGVEGNATSEIAFGGGHTGNVISEDGRYVVYESAASNLIDFDTNNSEDIFLWDNQSGATQCVSRGANGSESNGRSFRPTISADGQHVLFLSNTTNLEATNTTSDYDFYIYNRFLDSNTRSAFQPAACKPTVAASEATDAMWSSALLRLIWYLGDTNDSTDVFLHDVQTGTTTRVSVSSDGTQAVSGGRRPHIRADGRYIVFISPDDTLVSGDNDGQSDVFRYDRITGITERVSVLVPGTQNIGSSFEPASSADGRYVTFNSALDNVVAGDSLGEFDVFVRDIGTECDVTDSDLTRT